MPKTPTPIGPTAKPRAFAPEAGIDYGQIDPATIAAFRADMSARYGFETGRGDYDVIDDPFQKHQ